MHTTIKILFFASIFLVCSSAHGQADAEGSLVKWMSLEEAMRSNEKEPRPILVDFYTSWCGWCKQMMKTTYANPGLAQYINAFFYPVKFDAEGRDTVEYLGKKYGPSSSAPRAPHELTLQLMPGKLMYPTTLFLNDYKKDKKEFGVSMLANGFLDQQGIEPLLVYQVENVFRSAAYDDFRVQFNKAFYDTSISPVTPLKAAREIFREGVASTKKKLVFITTDWCNGCKVMRRTTFTDSLVAQYLSSTFDLVELEAQSTDTLYFQGQQYIRQPSQGSPFHPLAMVLSRNNLILPTLTVLDEELKPIDTIGYYLSPAFLDRIAHFFGDDIYKTKSWQVYVSELDEKLNAGRRTSK